MAAKKQQNISTLLTSSKVNAVPIPPAQTNTLLQVNNEVQLISERLRMLTVAESAEPPIVQAMLGLMYYSGLRVSEVLGLRGIDVGLNRCVYVRALKGSSPRVVSIVAGWSYLVNFVGVPCYLFDGYSRFYVYRLLKKYGISHSFNGSKVNSVTHFGRHYQALNLSVMDGGVNTVALGLGHKNVKSSSYYI